MTEGETRRKKHNDTGSSITHVEDDRGGNVEDDRRRGGLRVVPPPLRGAHVHGRLFRQRIRQFVQQGFRILPTDAGIGD